MDAKGRVSIKRLVIACAALSLLVMVLSSCASTPAIHYSYSEKGISLTSEPSGANVTITITSIVEGSSSSNTLNYVTPYYNPNDQFVTQAVSSDFEIKIKYYIEVIKPGYRPITMVVDDIDMRSVWHWKLEPLGGSAGQVSALGGLDEANALIDECLKFYDKEEYDTAIDLGMRALSMAKQYLEPDSLDIEVFYRRIGLSYVMRGLKSNDADQIMVDANIGKSYLKQALLIREKHLGRNHPETVKFRNTLLELYGTSFYE